MEVINVRDGEQISSYKASAVNALWRLIKYELLFGGIVTWLDDTSACVRTYVFNKCDETTLRMTRQEMEYLWPALAVWSESRSSEPVPRVGGSPLLLSLFVGPAMGGLFNKASTRVLQLIVSVMRPYLGDLDAHVFALLYVV